MIGAKIGIWSAAIQGGGGAIALPQLDNLIVWARSSAGVTVDGSDNVTALEDQSGSGNHANAISATPPTLLADALDGVAAIQHGGTTEYIGRTALVGGARGVASSLMLVVSLGDLASIQILAQTNPTDGTTAQRLQLSSVNRWAMYAGTTAPEASGTADTDWHAVLAVFHGDGTGTLYVDGVKVIDAQTVGTNDSDGWSVGRNSAAMSAGGRWTESPVWDVALSDSEVAQAFAFTKSLYPSLPAPP